MTSPGKKCSPGCAFPPQAARRRHKPVKYNTKKTYHVRNDEFLAAILCNDRRERGRERESGEAGELVLGKIGSVSQPGHWRSIFLFTARDAQSHSRIFFNYLSP